MILGWVNDKQTIARMNAQMTNSRLKTLMNNLSPEAKEIFYNIVSNNTGKISEDNKDIIVKLINEAQQAEKQKEIAEIEER